MTEQPLTREVVVKLTEDEYQSVCELAALQDLTPDEVIDLCFKEMMPRLSLLLAKHTRKH